MGSDKNAAATYKYFNVFAEALKPGRKTQDYTVVNRSSGSIIARIRWYGSWRQYCFFPEGETVWSDGCLTDVQQFIERLAKNRK